MSVPAKILRDQERSIATHAKTKVGHLERMTAAQRQYIRDLEDDVKQRDAEIEKLKHRLRGQKSAFSRLKKKVAGTVASAMGVAALIHPDFIPL